MRRINLSLTIALMGTAMLAGCAAPLLSGSAASAGYGVAHGQLGSMFGASSSADTAQGRDARQLKLQGVPNGVQVGQDAAPILRAMGEPPKEKSGNPQGYTCYEFPAVYSDTAAAVIVARNGKVVFFGNSRCVAEMQEANFRAGGKYAEPGGVPAPAGSAPATSPDNGAQDAGKGSGGQGSGDAGSEGGTPAR
ncbi:hypothetical protein [Candidimonas nitroreducens]|uniref:Lipoprotein n=1 Tax=Candidimonas nitroreducens TaxID=683354 RepID=A0A225MP80_9BURK|nr:hypothetical protein [Candidimonas nitroreducens]OWT60599.1 hypothetical protein CEY11_10235 [Candidimonas nitroreducens]